MAGLVVSTALTELRALLRDTNSAAQGFTDAQGIIMLNLGLLWWSENMERRTKRYTRASPFTFSGFSPTSEWAAGVAYGDTDWDADVAEVLEVGLDGFIQLGASNSVIPLERMGWAELRKRQDDAALVQAQPTHWAAFKHHGSHSWRFALFPIANNESTGPDVGWKVVGVVRVQPTPLVNTTDNIDLGASETRSIILLAAILLAPLVDRAELADVFKQMLPERVRDKMESTRTHDEVLA